MNEYYILPLYPSLLYNSLLSPTPFCKSSCSPQLVHVLHHRFSWVLWFNRNVNTLPKKISLSTPTTINCLHILREVESCESLSLPSWDFNGPNFVQQSQLLWLQEFYGLGILKKYSSSTYIIF